VLFAATVALLPFAVINAGAGLRELNQETVEMSVSFSRSRMRRTLLVILPMLVPYLFATLRLCSAIGWHIVPTAELLTGAGGIGTLISIARQRFWTDMIFAIALLDVIMVLVTDRLLFARLQKKMKNYYVA
jgi:ABC-type nitrate/sulfonate/bicarbonate transport system permease component